MKSRTFGGGDKSMSPSSWFSRSDCMHLQPLQDQPTPPRCPCPLPPSIAADRLPAPYQSRNQQDISHGKNKEKRERERERIWNTLSLEIPEAVERLNQALSPEVVETLNSDVPQIFEKLNRAVQFLDDWKTTTIVSVWGAAVFTCLSLTVTAGSCCIMARAQNEREKRDAAAAAAARAGQAAPAAPGLLGLLGARTTAVAIVTVGAAAAVAMIERARAAAAATEAAAAATKAAAAAT
ncbi:unnamed protein product [Prunus armeniaca]